MKEKRDISRKQFLAGGASVVFGAIFGKLSEHVYAEEKPKNTNGENNVKTGTEERDWDELPLDTLNGAYLVSDPESKLFGGTVEAEEYLLTQYFHVHPGLELMLTDTGEGDGRGGWVGFSKDLKPNAVLHANTANGGTGKRTLVSVPEGVYYLRGSGKNQQNYPKAWVKSVAAYALRCGLNTPDVSSYMEIIELNFDQRTRKEENGLFDDDTQNCPSLGDVFFSPIGTEIILTFNNANIAPYIYLGENYTNLRKKSIFDRHYGFGYAWYHCQTIDICSFLGAYYESMNNVAKKLTVDQLRAADPHLYIKFPSTVIGTSVAAKIRTENVKSNYQRLFTVVHVTDTHGDADSTHAAFEYADHVRADFLSLTGDYVPYYTDHGYNILHSLIKRAKTPVAYALGNHDAALSDKTNYEKCIAPIRDVLKIPVDQPYYYRDLQYGAEIVRVICLYPFYEMAGLPTKGYYTQKMLLWLCNAMSTTPTGGHIFILRHFSHHKPILLNKDDNMFYDFADDSTDISVSSSLSMGEDPVIEIVDAYNERKLLFAQYSGKLKHNNIETISIKYDFTNRPDSEFVAYFTGHLHCDHVGVARNTKTKQIVLGSICTTGVKGSEQYAAYTLSGQHRDYGTDSQIAFNVFTFDFQKKKIYVARVGNGSSQDREKTWMELSYKE